MVNKNFFKKIFSLSIDKKLLAVSILSVFTFMIIFETVQFVYMKGFFFSQKDSYMKKTHFLSTDIINTVISGHAEAMEYLSTNPYIIDFASSKVDFGYEEDDNIYFLNKYVPFSNIMTDATDIYGEVDAICVYTKAGYIYTNNTRYEFSLEDMFKSKWFEYLKKNGEEMLWCDDLYLSEKEQLDKNMIHCIRLIYSTNNYSECVGAVRLSFYKHRLKEIIGSNENGNVTFLKNDRGELLVSNEENFDTDFLSEISGVITKKENAGFKYEHNGEKYIIISAPIEYTDWVFVNVADASSFFGTYFITTAIIIAIMLIVFMLVVFLMTLYWKKVTKRFTTFVSTINSTSIDNLKLVDVELIDDDISRCITSYNNMINRFSLIIDERTEERKHLQRLEMNFLYEQLNPHFLFNTLSIINDLAFEENSNNILNCIDMISKYYRISLENTELVIPLRDELEHLKLYVEISNIRFRKRIIFDYDVPEELMDIKILKTILQPVVENSVIRAFKNKNSSGEPNKIFLMAYRKGKYVYIEVMDNGVGIAKEKLETILDPNKKGGIGLANTEKRIKLYYGDECGIKISSVEDEFTEVLFTLTDTTPEDVYLN